MPDLKKHWNKAYSNNDITKLGWYEEDPNPSLQLIQKCKFSQDARLLNVGVGASSLIDELVNLGYKNVIASDISDAALEKLQARLGIKKDKVQWIVDDLTNPAKLSEIDAVDLWHDRAVLHFFTEEKDQDRYFSLLKRKVKQNGFVLISTFNTEGATKCSGLQVHRYNKSMLVDKLGANFKLVEYFNYTYTMPSGDTRPYIYTIFKRI
ncbi:MAG: class I SAM-dependent methyltransferase [Bacteroidetes bacterium]|nr:class I SAM-dependent methyltransferase [Bacteroidota bacterium]